MLLKGRYEILRALSPKSQLALDRRTGREVVVRELALRGLKDWSVLERLEVESKTLAVIRHSAVPAFVDSFSLDDQTPDPRFFLVRAHVEGTPLSSRLAHRMSDEALLALARRLFTSLSELHRLSPPLLHGDLSPERISERQDGSLVFLGFGAASVPLLDDQSGCAAPERSAAEATVASELYSAGSVLYRLATQRDPGVISRTNGRALLGLEVSPPRLRATLARLLDSDPSSRPGSALDALALLEREPEETALALPRETSLGPPRAQGRAAPAVVALIALMGTVLAASSPGVALLLLPAVVVALYMTLRPGGPENRRRRTQEQEEDE